MQRRYDPEFQVSIARRIRLRPSPVWEAFRNAWQAFNALYNLVERGGAERAQASQIIREFIDETDAARVLAAAEDEVLRICEVPPGDMRFERRHPRFRAKASAYFAAAELDRRPR